jgi:hypothetical protein
MVGASYDSDDRVLITVKSGTMQYDDAIAGALFYDDNVTLPVPIGDFNDTLTKISFHFIGSVNMTGGFWNERVFGAGVYAPGTWVNETLYNAMHQGGGNDLDGNDTWSHINLTMNNTNWVATVYYYYEDVAGIRALITATETDETDPNVAEHWSVNDTMTVGTLSFPIDMSLVLKYPTTAIKDEDFYWNATVTTGSNESFVYQKYGPAHDPDDVTVSGTAGDVSIAFNSKDKQDNALWVITFADEQYGGKFANIDATSLVIEMNGKTIEDNDYTLTADSLTLEKVDVKDSDNTLEVTWTEPTAPPITPGAVVQPWYMTAVEGIPVWAIIGVIAFVVVVLFIASKK